jgi:hypothetical protein
MLDSGQQQAMLVAEYSIQATSEHARCLAKVVDRSRVITVVPEGPTRAVQYFVDVELAWAAARCSWLGARFAGWDSGGHAAII